MHRWSALLFLARAKALACHFISISKAFATPAGSTQTPTLVLDERVVMLPSALRVVLLELALLEQACDRAPPGGEIVANLEEALTRAWRCFAQVFVGELTLPEAQVLLRAIFGGDERGAAATLGRLHALEGKTFSLADVYKLLDRATLPA